jgi:hypothetical protein
LAWVLSPRSEAFADSHTAQARGLPQSLVQSPRSGAIDRFIRPATRALSITSAVPRACAAWLLAVAQGAPKAGTPPVRQGTAEDVGNDKPLTGEDGPSPTGQARPALGTPNGGEGDGIALGFW